MGGDEMLTDGFADTAWFRTVTGGNLDRLSLSCNDQRVKLTAVPYTCARHRLRSRQRPVLRFLYVCWFEEDVPGAP